MTALTVHLPFVGFTYTNKSKLSDNPPALFSSDSNDTVDSGHVGMLKSENQRLQQEVDMLKKQLASKTIAETPVKGGDGESMTWGVDLVVTCLLVKNIIIKLANLFFHSLSQKSTPR